LAKLGLNGPIFISMSTFDRDFDEKQ